MRSPVHMTTRDNLQFDKQELVGEDFCGLKLGRFTAIQSDFRNCRFEKLKIDQACFGAGTKQSQYLDCSFDGSTLRAIAPGIARFVRCSFRNVRIREFFGLNVEFVECVFTGRIEKAVFQGRLPESHGAEFGRKENEFRGNDFRGAELIDVAFRGGIDLDRQLLPDGPDYLYVPNAPDALEKVKRRVIAWRDLELRRLALAIIKVWEWEVDGGQKQLLLTRGGVVAAQREAADLLFQELRGGN